MSNLKEVSDSSFEQDVLASATPVLVDFWAKWCGPCKMITPALEDIARDLSDRLVVAKVNIDDNPDIATRYRVQGIPMMILFRNGKQVDMRVGAAPKSTLQQWVENLL